MNAIIAYLLTNAPLILIIGGLIFLTYKATKYHERIQKTHSKCDELIEKSIPSINTKIDNISITVNELAISVNKIATYIVASDKKLTNDIFITKSPTELSPLGDKILDEIGGKKYIEENVSTLIEKMKLQNFKSGLDVENYSTLVLIEESRSDAFTPIKNFIYNNPIYKVSEERSLPLDINLCFSIMAIYLRNKYFEVYPDLKKDL